MDGEIIWVGVWTDDIFFSKRYVRTEKDVKFGTKVASSAMMMCALRFLEKVILIVAYLQENVKIGQK